MRSLKLIAAMTIFVGVLGGLYVFLESREYNREYGRTQAVLLEGDAVPQLLRYPLGSTLADEITWYFEGDLPLDYQEKFDAIDTTYFPHYDNGEIHPPLKYGVGNRYSKQDIKKMESALKTAHRYADINRAVEDGYRIISLPGPTFDPGMGIHAFNINYVLDREVRVEKPEFLTYVKNRYTGSFQLMQLGFIDQRTTHYKLFDAEEALGHFHPDASCLAIDSDIYFAVFSTLDKRCKPNMRNLDNGTACDDGEYFMGPIWMMHFAVNVYNEHGMFEDSFPYVNYASSKGVAHSFYGKEVSQNNSANK